MVNINTLGIIFPNTYDELIPDIALRRTMASVPFAGRHRFGKNKLLFFDEPFGKWT